MENSGAVSCTSRRFCVLTGGQRPEIWDGSRWRVMSIARKAWGYMGPVSCVSASACVAIAFKARYSGPATSERWNGRTWSVLAPIPRAETYINNAPPGPEDTMSCGSMRACVALLPTFTGDWAVLSWKGRSWHDAPAALYQKLTSGLGSTPQGVSCGAPTVCTIVGLNYTGGLVLRLADGSAQFQGAAPVPGNATNVYLNSVSCAHATCMTVGDYPDAAGTPQTLAEQYR